MLPPLWAGNGNPPWTSRTRFILHSSSTDLCAADPGHVSVTLRRCSPFQGRLTRGVGDERSNPSESGASGANARLVPAAHRPARLRPLARRPLTEGAPTLPHGYETSCGGAAIVAHRSSIPPRATTNPCVYFRDPRIGLATAHRRPDSTMEHAARAVEMRGCGRGGAPISRSIVVSRKRTRAAGA